MSSFSITDFLHQLFTIVWIGGMIFMGLAFKPSLSAIDAGQAGRLFGAVGKRFTILAWLSMIILLVTGLMKTPDGALFDTSPGYGLALTVKHILYLLAVLFGAIITFVLVPRIQRNMPKPGETPSAAFVGAQKALEGLSMTNMFIGVAIVALATML